MRIVQIAAVFLAAFLILDPGMARADSRKAVTIRVDHEGFHASQADIEAVCRSAANQLLRHMPDVSEFMVDISRGRHGPIALFKRGPQGEYRIKLATEKTFWAQYAYQFSHEICHVLCGYEDDDRSNLWFEETLCEAASLYCLRAMSHEWRTKPPYGNWRGYSSALSDYAANIQKGRDDYIDILRLGLPEYYRMHGAHLSQNPTDRKKNGAMALVILRLLERTPGHWNAVRWLNSSPSSPGETFLQYLTKWRNAVPMQHREFVDSIGTLFGLSLEKPHTTR